MYIRKRRNKLYIKLSKLSAPSLFGLLIITSLVIINISESLGITQKEHKKNFEKKKKIFKNYNKKTLSTLKNQTKQSNENIIRSIIYNSMKSQIIWEKQKKEVEIYFIFNQNLL